MSKYDQWKLSGPDICMECDDNGYDSCDEHEEHEPDPDREWDSRADRWEDYDE